MSAIYRAACAFSEVGYRSWAVFGAGGVIAWAYVLGADYLFANGVISAPAHILADGIGLVLCLILLGKVGMALVEGYEKTEVQR